MNWIGRLHTTEVCAERLFPYKGKIAQSLRAGKKQKPLRERLLRAGFRASMAVEASLVLPLFLFFLMNVLFAMDYIRLQSNFTHALQQTGQELSEVAFYYRYGLSDLLDGSQENDGWEGEMGNDFGGLGGKAVSFLLSETYVRERVASDLGREYLDHTCLEGGCDAISYLQSSILEEDDIIDLVADYRIRPFIRILGVPEFSMQSRYYTHAFVGYEVGEPVENVTPEETYVYITETGTVYHLSENCTYLKPSIQAVDAVSVDSLRNNGGAKYYPCEICHPGRFGTVLITNEGNRYHTDASCHGLKRTIRTVPLSSVQGKMPACSKCGGG